jgi:hypothetical protein
MATAPTKKTYRKRSRATQVELTRPRFQGWRTSDEEEIERRRTRAREEEIRVEETDPRETFHGSFLAHSPKGDAYQVEIRSLLERVNSCDCPDYQVNGLGTCKHIEAALQHLQQGPKERFEEALKRGSSRIEIFLDRRADRVRILWPQGSQDHPQARSLLSPFFSSDGTLLGEPLMAIPALRRAIEGASSAIRARIRLSVHLDPWLERLRRETEHRDARRSFEEDVKAGKRSLDVVDLPLYEYQREGMLHLAFTGRALLADEMGLGKTVQAVAACELLRRLHGIERVLIVSPVSLKAEWEEQIAKFTGLPSLLIQGPRATRLRQYRERSFFYLANYEQVRPDVREINRILAPDVVILDEAQRIKNWQTKTAEAVKRLHSPYAFVLTGTPLENRIDEVYSIVQFLDPRVFGPLFRFNRDFYQLDEKGRPAGYKNLDEMHRRLHGIMLRRRKSEVEDQLPGRTVNTFFVAMDEEQLVRYEQYNTRVARLLALAKRRPLTREELEKLQKWLACMRMLCDSPFILDPQCRISPKLHELEDLLTEITTDETHKLIIFSEWERMLELVRELAERMGLPYAWHTGSVPQPQRRTQIRRFKDDPACRLFLSTDSGSVGLNLQAANVVINLDQPWNPARLEQRIARAWRKHQARSVQVVNLVAENSIEHRILHLLEQKRTLAEGVLDGSGDLTEMALPTGRAAFLERLEALMGERVPGVGEEPAAAAPTDPADRLRQDVLSRWPERVELLEIHGPRDGEQLVLAVLDRADEALHRSIVEAVDQHFPMDSTRLELLDRNTYASIQRLLQAGVLHLGSGPGQSLHRSPSLEHKHVQERALRLKEARRRLAAAEPKQRMARVLAEGGFPIEAMAPLGEALETALQSLAHLLGEEAGKRITMATVESRLVKEGLLPAEAPDLVARIRASEPLSIERAEALIADGHRLLGQANETLERAALT